jgi:hypothetical protein
MRNALIVLTLLFTVVLGLTIVAADDTQPESGSPEDNACNPGGVLYREDNQDGCPSLWHWKAGWFLARFLTGEISRADFPKEFESVLPPLPQAEAAGSPTTICHQPFSPDDSFCINLDNTAYRSTAGMIGAYYLFVADTATCPATYNGLTHPNGWFGPKQNWIDQIGFTVAELDYLGVADFWCGYM